MRSRLIASTLLLLGSSALLAETAGLPFEVTTVARQNVSAERLLDGRLDAVNQTTVSAETSGVVEQLFYDVDDFVEKGAILVVLKDVTQKAGVNQAKASEAEALARLKQAQAEYERVKGIFERQLVAKSKMDAAEAELKSAQARYNSSRAAVSSASEQADNTRVRAPYAGYVVQRHVELGEYVNVGQPLMTGVQLERLRVNVDVPQRLINDVRKFKTARVIGNQPGEAVPAVKDMVIFPYAEAGTNTFSVRLNLEDGADGLFPGMFIKVAFMTGEDTSLVVPEEAIAYRSEVTGVYVVDENNRPYLRQIRLGRKAGDGTVVVLAGLDEGESIALDPVAAGIYLKQQQAEAKAHE